EAAQAAGGTRGASPGLLSPGHRLTIRADQPPLAPLVPDIAAGGLAKAGVGGVTIERVPVVGDLPLSVGAGHGPDHARLQPRARARHRVAHQQWWPGTDALTGAAAAIAVALDVVQRRAGTVGLVRRGALARHRERIVAQLRRAPRPLNAFAA